MSIYYSKLFSIPFSSELYLNRYAKFIESCLEKNKDLPLDVYTEKHHILPKSLFPEFSNLKKYRWNMAILTGRQHFIAHMMLWKSFRNEATTYSANMMRNRFGDKNRNSRLYEQIRIEHSKYSGEKNKNFFPARDSENIILRVTKDDPRWVSKELTHVRKGTVVVKDCDGEILVVSIKDRRYLDGEFSQLTEGMTTVRDKEGNVLHVSVDDKRFKDGEVFGICKGMTPAKTKEGKHIQVMTDDKRFETGELQHMFSGMRSALDKDGNILHVSVNDERFKNGELVSHNSGVRHPKFTGWYVTPEGTFETSAEANKKTGMTQLTIIKWCKLKSESTITNKFFSQSKYLQKKYKREDVVDKKTYRDLGFSFIEK